MSEHKTEPKELRIIVLSDGTGETAAQITRAAMVQFSDKEIYFTRYKHPHESTSRSYLFEDAAIHHDMVVYTIVCRSFACSFTESYRKKRSNNRYPRTTLEFDGPVFSSRAQSTARPLSSG